MQLGNTTPEHVLKIMKKAKLKSSNDIFGVSTKMVKHIGSKISQPLSHIFNLSLETGIFPEILKQCRIIPIFKNGNHLECDNYRPISLLSSISKILEKIVSEKLLNHLKVGGNEKQWGSGRSQMLGNGLGPWRSRFIYNLNTQLLNKNHISFCALSSKMNKRLL